MSNTSTKTSPILNAFDSLRAEYEGDWLLRVFVPPKEFLSMAGTRSLVVFGGEGAGKTALRIALQQHAIAQDGNAAPLAVRWHPMAIYEEPRQVVQVFMRQMLDATAQELLYHVYRYPNTLKNSAAWVQELIAWFVQTFFSGNWEFELERLNTEFQAGEIDGLQQLFSKNARQILPADAPPAGILSKVSAIAKGLGLRGVRVYIDGIEPWVDYDREIIAGTLKALLSTLALYEEPGFVIKIMAPSQLEVDVLSASSTIRRRWEIYKLNWPSDQLMKMLEARLKVMLGKDSYEIKDLYVPQELQEWLATYGGNSPRAWLELARPLIQHQRSKKRDLPLSQKEFTAIRDTHTPKLWIDVDTNKVFIGSGEITNLQPLAKRLLRYIYAQRNRTCTREDLYFKGHKRLDYIPQSTKDDNWEARKQWEKSIDTALYRIRQKIEPDPQNPIYLISDTGKSTVHLNHTW